MAMVGLAGLPAICEAGVLRFEGGKGVRGAGRRWWLVGPALLTWIIIAFFFRYSSLASLVAAAFAPFFTFWAPAWSAYSDAALAMHGGHGGPAGLAPQGEHSAAHPGQGVALGHKRPEKKA